MRNLQQALTDIAAMRVQMARSTVFKGYGPITLAVTSGVAVVAAAVQTWWLPDAAARPLAYLTVWILAAMASIAVVGLEVVSRSRRVHSGLAEEMVFIAIEQFLPAFVVGALLPFVLFRCARESLWMLPGLWQVVLSLGMFASLRSVPRPLIVVGIWYMGSGFLCLAFAHGSRAFSPWVMGIPFGVGQLLAAAVLQYVEGRYEEE